MNPELITWARKRAKLGLEKLAEKKEFERSPEWETGQIEPTRSQLHRFAREVRIPEGYLYLSKPPDESLKTIGLSDFRTVGGAEAAPSPDMYAVIYACQRRQAWFLEFAASESNKPNDVFTGTQSSKSPDQEGDAKSVARDMAAALKFGLGEQEKIRRADDAIRKFMRAARDAGVLVIRHKKVENSNERILKKEEFRGLALSDPRAPLVFINGADSKSAQMFTLAHELAHLWLGDTGVSSADAVHTGNYSYSKKEAWCNCVAAEFLVPMKKLDDMHSYGLDEIGRKADSLHVSRLVILRRLLDAERIDEATHDELVKVVFAEHKKMTEDASASNNDTEQERKGFIPRGRQIISDLGDTFVRAVLTSTFAREIQSTEAFSLLDANNTATLRKMGEMLGCDSAG